MKRLSILLLVIFTVSCGEKELKPTIDKSISGQEIPTQESWDSQIVFSQNGNLRAILYAKHLRDFEKQNVTLLEGIKINFFNKQQKITSTLTAKRGRVNNITKNMYAIDSVVVVNDSGVVLKTKELMWNNRLQEIVTNKFVTIDDHNEHIEGYGFKSDERFDHYIIKKITYTTTK